MYSMLDSLNELSDDGIKWRKSLQKVIVFDRFEQFRLIFETFEIGWEKFIRLL